MLGCIIEREREGEGERETETERERQKDRETERAKIANKDHFKCNITCLQVGRPDTEIRRM